MILANIKLSFPHITYDVEVSHFASRKATTIEWVVLEGIHVASKSDNFHDAPFSGVFEEIFSLKDTDRLIKPIIQDLVGFGMIKADGLSDDISLENMVMSNFELTDKGEKLRKEGVLPGLTTEDAIHIDFDVYNELVSDMIESNLSGEPTGIKTVNIDKCEDVVFPSSGVLDFLSQSRNNKLYPWLVNETQIRDMDIIESQLSWKNVSKHFIVGPDLNCSLKDMDEIELDSAVLKELDLPKSDDVPMAPLIELSSEIECLDRPDNLNKKLKELLSISDMVLIHHEYVDEFLESLGDDERTGRVFYVSSSDILEERLEKKSLIIRVSEEFLSEGLIMSGVDKGIFCGTFRLTAGTVTRETPLVYSSRTESGFTAGVCERIAKTNFSESPLSIVPLYRLKDEKSFLELVNSVVEHEEDFPSAARLVVKIDTAIKTLYEPEGLSAEAIKSLLSEKLRVVFNDTTYDNVIEKIASCEEVDKISEDSDYFGEVIRVAISALPESSQINQIWNLWEAIDERGWKRTAILSKSLLRNTYSDDCIRQILSVFDSADLYAMPAYTPIERSILQLRSSCDAIKDLMPQVDFYKPMTEEESRLCCVSSRESLDRVYIELKRWREHHDKLKELGVVVEDVAYEGMRISDIAISMSNLAKGISPFYDERALKYDTVYVADTCALMNEPSIIDAFNDDKAMLIITQITLQELDKNKDSNDDDKAYKARDAIRAINNHKAFEWLNLREKGNPELLSDDYDMERNDNKILSVLVKYIIKKPVLITDDINLRNLAEANAVQSIESAEFLELKRKVEKEKRKSKSKKRQEKR